MTTRTRTTSAAAILAAFLMIGLSACGDDAEVRSLRVSLISPDGDPFPTAVINQIGEISISSYRGQTQQSNRCVPFERGRISLPSIGFGSDNWIVVEAYDSGGCEFGNVLASGSTAPFDVMATGAPTEVLLFVTEPDSFNTVYADFSEGTASSPYESGGGRAGHTLTRLAGNDGYAIVGGAEIATDGSGIGGTPIVSLNDTLQYFDPYLGFFTTVRENCTSASKFDCPDLVLSEARAFHTATLLDDGRVVIAGGLINSNGAIVPTESVEILTPTGDGITGELEVLDPASQALLTPRAMHTTTKLADGRLLVVGGFTQTWADPQFPRSVEELIPGTQLQFNTIDGTELEQGRALHTAVRFQPEGVVIVGGRTASDVVSRSETLFLDEASLTVRLDTETTGVPAQPRFAHSATRIRLSVDGESRKYMGIAGGYTEATAGNLLAGASPTATAEFFDADLNEFRFQADWAVELQSARAFGSLATLPLSNDLLFVGGFEADGSVSGAADRLEQDELSTVPAYSSTPIVPAMRSPRAMATATAIDSGMFFITGGFDGTDVLDSSEWYNPGDFCRLTDSCF